MDASEELQRLDTDLAAGRVDATSYRRRRDVLVVRRREEEAAARAAAAATKTTPEPPASTPVPAAPAVDATPSGEPPPAVEPVVDPLPVVPDPLVEPAAVGPAVEPTADPLPITPPVADPLPPVPAPTGEGHPRPAYPSEGPLRSAGGSAGGSAGPPTDAFPVPRVAPARPPAVATPAVPSSDPFPPPFRWGPAPATADAETTQVVAGAADSTQIVPPSTFQPPTFASPERTQVVPGDRAGRRPSAPVPASRTTPPWTERPPERQDPSSGMAGSDVFYGGRRDLASTLGTLAVVVVVILILVLSFTLG